MNFAQVTKIRIVSFCVAVAMTLQSVAAEQCVFLFPSSSDGIIDTLNEQETSLKLIAIQHFYQNAVNFLQKHVTVSSFRSTTAIQERNKMNMIDFLKNGKYEEAIDIYRDKFDAVELSYWMIKNDQKALSALEKKGTLSPKLISARTKLRVRLQIFERRFAKHYGEYISIRTYLEKIVEEAEVSPIFLDAAKKTIRYLGVHKFSKVYEDFKSLNIPEKRPSLSDIKNLYRSKAKFTRLKLWNDFKNEIISVIKFAISSEVVIGAVHRIFNKFPPNVAFHLKAFTGVLESAKLNNRYLPLLVEIESLPDDQSLRLEDLRQKNSTTPHDELLITYARMVDFTDSWNELKAHAATRAEEPNNLIYKKFYERMLDAEQKAMKLPDRSLFEETSNIDTIFIVIQAGIVLKLVGVEKIKSWDDLARFLSFIPGLGS